LERKPAKETILFIDDTPANLEILIRIFQKESYKVRAVTSGQKGIRAAENDPPDIILLDVNMPDMNGYEVCRLLKQSENLKHIPVIFISALTETFDKVAAFESGGIDYITKPIQIQEALARVKTHLSLRRYQQLLETRNKDLNEALNQLKETQSQLINSEKMASLGVLTAGIAHEINNPISFIYTSSLGLVKNIQFLLDLQNRYDEILSKSDVSLLKEIKEYQSEHDFSERLSELTSLSENINNGAKRISGIVKSLRVFSRIDETDMKEIDLHEAIDSTLVLLQHKIINRIRIVKEYNSIPPICCFPARISQVLMNILSNAVESIETKPEMNENEQIIINTGLITINDNEFAVIQIRDSGTGIPTENIKKVFDPFFTTKPVGKGMGLGLSISNNIIREHGGKIEVTSQEGFGASFNILLPIKCLQP
jgi:two-component system NtrC family sensor kinase